MVILSEKFAREGYLLKGWATSAGGGVVYKLGQNMTYKTAASLKLYAVWEETWLNRKTEPNKIGIPTRKVISCFRNAWKWVITIRISDISSHRRAVS